MPTAPDITCLQEPELQVPGRKPVGPSRVDWGHPLSDNLAVCVLPKADIVTEEVTRSVCPYTSMYSPALGPDEYGVAFQTVRTGSGYGGSIRLEDAFGGKSPMGGATHVSATFVYRDLATTCNQTNLLAGARELYCQAVYSKPGVFAMEVYFSTYTHYRVEMSSSAGGPGTLFHITMQFRAPDIFEFWVNGKLYPHAVVSVNNQGTGPHINDNSSRVDAGYAAFARVNYGNYNVPNKGYFACLHKNRWLSPEEILSLHRDPYQFLIPA